MQVGAAKALPWSAGVCWAAGWGAQCGLPPLMCAGCLSSAQKRSPAPWAPARRVLRAVSQVGVVSAFAQTLRRYTSLNHLAQAARAVLQNTSQINQMLSDLNRVDFANVQVTDGGFFLSHVV